MPTIEADGLTVSYETAGAGPSLILLHGAAGTGRDHFRALLPGLAPGFRTYSPDARGHGSTRSPGRGDPDLSTARMVADVLAFADALGLATFHLLGYSMGGMTALSLAAAAPARLRTLVAISVSPEREPRLSVVRALLDPGRIEQRDPAWAARLARQHDPAHGEGAWRRLLPAIVQDVERQPLLAPAELRAIAVPTLVVAGDRDPLVPVDQALALSRQVRDGRLLILPGVGHDALVEAPVVLQAALTAFHAASAPDRSTDGGTR